jgi:hypothetical protein
MDFLKFLRNIAPIAPLLLAAGCSMNAPVATDEGGCSFSITAAATAVRPEALNIHLVDKTGAEKSRLISPVPDNGTAVFNSIPFGRIVVDITGNAQGARVLYGHAETDVQTPNALVTVRMAGIIATRKIDAAQELGYFQNVSGRSPFWGALTKDQTAWCAALDGRASLLAAAGVSTKYLYFLFEVSDSTLLGDERSATTFGEFTSDAVIMYLSKTPPFKMSMGNQPFPASRFQCQVGKPLPENGMYNFQNFETGTIKNGALRDVLSTPDLTARVLPAGIGFRLVEVRISKALLGLGEDATAGVRLLGLVVRYRNNINVQQPAQTIDWQSGIADNDPRTNVASWGYLEVGQ